METLSEIYSKYPRCDKGSTHSYISLYEELLNPYRNGSILEIGLFWGDSLRVWEEYFSGRKVGVDCSELPHDGLADLTPMIKERTHDIRIFNAEDEREVNRNFILEKPFEIIIEDAGHEINQQINLFRIWKNYVAPNGIYIIEDIQEIDKTQHLFIGLGFKIIDRRYVKGRYDDVLAVRVNPMVK